MKNIKNKVIDFLKSCGMDHEDIDIDGNCRVFLDEMEKGLAGENSSLAMLPTYIETERDIPTDKNVIVMDAGGTNFRVATVYFDKNRKPVICKENNQLLDEKDTLQPYEMPGVGQEVSKEQFFNTMAGYVKQVIDKSDHIGFCFSYPIEMFPNKDGRVLYFSKEIRAKEVTGEMIGENLNLAIHRLGHGGKKHTVLLNDTVTALLAGRSSFPDRTFESYIGFILGTGTNCCYVEHNKNITKKKDLDPTKSQIVNIESGGFARAPRGIIDRALDASSVSSGTNVFEKMISGAYLGELCLRTAQSAGEAHLFSDAVVEQLMKIKKIDTRDINDFLYYPTGANNVLSSTLSCGNESDVVTLYYLIDRLVERAAKLSTISLSSAVIKSGRGTNPCFPICIVAEGTTFYRLKSLKPRVEYYMKTYLENQKNLYYEIVDIENATLIGAAIAGLTN